MVLLPVIAFGCLGSGGVVVCRREADFERNFLAWKFMQAIAGAFLRGPAGEKMEADLQNAGTSAVQCVTKFNSSRRSTTSIFVHEGSSLFVVSLLRRLDFVTIRTRVDLSTILPSS